MNMSNMRLTVSNRESHCLALARSVLGRLEQVSGRKQFPVPVETIASLCGYQVIVLTTLSPELSGIVSLNKKLIGINGKHHPRRQRFSLAHELGHILLKHQPEVRSTQEEVKRFNREADLFAAELLMPSDDLRIMAAKECDLSILRVRYEVSNEALCLKLASLSPGYRPF
jgi:Zn-dependent peptidase ImmA (M78 family)